MSGPPARLHERKRLCDELLHLAETALCLLALAVDFPQPPAKLCPQLIGGLVGVERLHASLGDRPAADFGHPADRSRVAGMESNCTLIARQSAIVDTRLLGVQLHTAPEFGIQLLLRKLRPGLP